MKDKRQIVFIGLLFFFWLFAGHSLLVPGFIPTHDGEYHIIRFHEFFTMLSHGYLFPRWAPGLNSGYGFPLFNFHYPFPNYVGSLFHALGIGLVDSFKLSLFSGYVLASFACFFWLKKLFRLYAAFVGTVVFSFVPYWFVDIYVRGSIGEVFALMWVMIALSSIEYKKWVWVALSVAGLVVSHNILAMVFVPLLFLYSLLRRPRAIWFMVTGMYISAYFWLPAIFEREYVQGLNSAGFSEHFPDIIQLLVPSWGTGFSRIGALYDEMSQQIGIVPLIALFTSTLFLIRERQKKVRLVILTVVLCSFVAIYFMLPASSWIWHAVPMIQFVQYPWRLLSLLIPFGGILSAYTVGRSKRWFFGGILVILAITCAFSYTKPVIYAPRSDEYYLTRKEFTDGTSSMGNSLSTIWSGWRSERANELVTYREGAGEIQYLKIKPLRYDFAVNSIKNSILTVHTLYYPGWNVWVDGSKMRIDKTGGIIEFPVSAGNHNVRIEFGETPFRLLANCISLLSLFWLLGLAILKGRYEHRY